MVDFNIPQYFASKFKKSSLSPFLFLPLFFPFSFFSNQVESPFAAARLCTDAAKRFRVVKNATAVIWTMLLVAEQAFRRVKHPELMPAVYRGGTFIDGMPVNKEVAA